MRNPRTLGVVVALLMSGQVGAAQGGNGKSHGHGTPDEMPPANEDVCQALIGATPGLYGLCVAFCEAQDCEVDLAAEDPFASCKPPSRTLLDRYDARKQEGIDPDMPCLPDPPSNGDDICPCWSQSEIENLRFPNFGDGDESQACLVDIFTDITIGWNIERTVGDGMDYLTNIFVVSNGSDVCRLRDDCDDGNCLNETRLRGVETEEQMAACHTQLVEATAARGLNCPIGQ